MGDVIEIDSESDSESDVEFVAVTVRDSETCSRWHTCAECSRSRGPRCSWREKIDLTDESEVHNQVNSSTEEMGSMQVISTNCCHAEQTPQIPVSSSLNNFILDSDGDLMDDDKENLSSGLQSDWIMGNEELDLKSSPVLKVEDLADENLLIPISSSVSNEDSLSELDFFCHNEAWVSCIHASNGDFCGTSSHMSSSSACSPDSTTNIRINSDVESLEAFSPVVHISYLSSSSAGYLLEDCLKSSSEETNNTKDELEPGLSMDVEDIPPLIPQNSEDFKMNSYHFPPNLNIPVINSWKQLPNQNQSDLPIGSKVLNGLLGLDQPGDQIVSSDKSESHLLTSYETKEVSPNCTIDEEMLQSLHYFMGVPVQHLFIKPHRNVKWHKVTQNTHSSSANRNGSKEPEMISQRQYSLINSTIDENFYQGTLQFLMDFVSPLHYPPDHIVKYIIKRILLSNQPSGTIMSAYMTLMKIQQLHPANILTVQWDWELLAYHVENKDHHRNDSQTRSNRLLFLQYVVQTLEDDFQLNRDVPQQSIAKAVLSCDEKFSNVSVIKWLVDTISKDSEEIHEGNGPTSSLSHNLLVVDTKNSRIICLLQKMLTLAVEVDRSPTCSSNKIAEVIFQHFIYISKRSQRLTMLRSMESQLLRCKLLEFIFHHYTKKQNTLPISLGKILHFLRYAKFPTETDEYHSSKWQCWDELVHLLCLLLLSYQEVTKRHLRLSITERVKYVLADAPPMLTTHDVITVKEVLKDVEEFYSRVFSYLGRPLNSQLEEQIRLLKDLLLCAATTK
ncbi:SUMO-interacting motif-containing protein 1 isoform X2 [Narcine bancroftii]|uniref:SUMO-interacting motif-containing protein 1 isoform X2 n=1 Tax=Narcine bancroftii TaxID=1343680 RepID=UPI003831DB89